jgi:DNA primase
MGFCNYGEYQNRIIIPSFDSSGHLNFFTARSYTEAWLKYKNPRISKDIIFNDLNIDWSSSVTLVEGPFDAIKCANSIPLLGSSLRENSKLFQKICKYKPDIFLAMDQDAKSKQFTMAKKLKQYGIRVRIIDTYPHSDIGEMSKKEITRRKQNASIVSEVDYLRYRLNF